jgi:signal transduction histidine kinase
MKKKILLALGIFSVIFVVGGIYIIATIEISTSQLDHLIMLHQVEILREHLLNNLRSVQSDLLLLKTRHKRDMDTIIANVKDMDGAVESCFDCHHSEDVLKRLTDLESRVYEYKDSLNRVLTLRADRKRMVKEEDRAFTDGEHLIVDVNTMVHMAALKLADETQSALENVADSKILIYILVAVGPIIAISFGFIFIRALTTPLNALLRATRELRGGDLDHRIEGLKDEFGEVASSFNQMAASLKEQMSKMQRAEQMVLLGELAAGLAHEIKNPLAGIKVSVEVLAEELSISEEDRAIVLKLSDEIRRIELLIKNLLNFARPPRPEFILVDINDILDITISFSLNHPTTIVSSASAVIDVSKDLDKNVPKTMADPMQVRQIFLNLLLNAVQAMPNGGTLSVKTRYHSDSDSIKITISDTGEGIDKEAIDNIFQPFFTTKAMGTGLGLPITRRLVEQHGGEIFVESIPGKGSEFNISLQVKYEDKE